MLNLKQQSMMIFAPPTAQWSHSFFQVRLLNMGKLVPKKCPLRIPSNDHSIPMGKKKLVKPKPRFNPCNKTKLQRKLPPGRSLEEKAFLRRISPRFLSAGEKILWGEAKKQQKAPELFFGTKKVADQTNTLQGINISHQTGSSENHRLKSAIFGGIC